MKRLIQQAHTANEEKKFRCEICGKRFLANNMLQNHIDTHTGEKTHVQSRYLSTKSRTE